jgi:predicted lipoprotein with Yx(FWY)xxD motif
MEKRSGPACALVAAALAAVTLGGCSNGSSTGVSAPDKSYAASPTATATPTAGAAAQLSLRTLDLFEADKTTKSTCNGACAGVWPPLTTSGRPMAGQGVKASLMTTSTRNDGRKQVVYNKHPLYYYSGDSKAGDTNGQALNQFGAEWYVLDAAGNKVEKGGRS